MQNQYLHLLDVAECLGFAPGTIRCMKAVTAPDLPSMPVRGCPHGRPTDFYELETVLEWLRRCMQRVSPEQEYALRRAARPLNTVI